MMSILSPKSRVSKVDGSHSPLVPSYLNLGVPRLLVKGKQNWRKNSKFAPIGRKIQLYSTNSQSYIKAFNFEIVNKAALSEKISENFGKFRKVFSLSVQFLPIVFEKTVDGHNLIASNGCNLKWRMTSQKSCNEIWTIFSKILGSTVPASFVGSPGTPNFIFTFSILCYVKIFFYFFIIWNSTDLGVLLTLRGFTTAFKDVINWPRLV